MPIHRVVGVAQGMPYWKGMRTQEEGFKPCPLEGYVVALCRRDCLKLHLKAYLLCTSVEDLRQLVIIVALFISVEDGRILPTYAIQVYTVIGVLWLF